MEAYEIARDFNWEPEFDNNRLHEQLKKGKAPAGFGRLVGQTIVLFKMPMPFGKRDEDNDRAVVARLCRLRLLIAKMPKVSKCCSVEIMKDDGLIPICGQCCKTVSS